MKHAHSPFPAVCNIIFKIALTLFLGAALSALAQQDQSPTSLKETKAKAEAGDAAAQLALGICYEQGIGVPRDEGQAIKWWRKAAAQGLARAQFNLGFFYVTGGWQHSGFSNNPSNLTQAVKWFRESADQGLAMGQMWVGLCYSKGKGVATNLTEAAGWFRRAADQG